MRKTQSCLPESTDLYLLHNIPQYEHLKGYGIDINGDIWSCRFNPDKFYSQWSKLVRRLDTKGYYQFSYTLLGKKRYTMVHKLMALAYLPKVEGTTEVNHKNGIRTDNRIENLEWVSRGQNIKHSYDILKRKRIQGTMNRKAKLNDEKVREIKKMIGILTIREIAKMYDTHHSLIQGIKDGKRWPHVI